MSASRTSELQLRLDRPDLERLGRAFALSLAIHLALFGLYEARERVGWLQRLPLPAFLRKAHQAMTDLKDKQTPAAESQMPLLFVDVSPAQATTEAPEQAKYYSDKHARAANPEADVDSNVPKVTGTQEQVVKTEDVPRAKAFPLQPAPAQAPPGPETVEEATPKPSEPPGDLVLAKPEPLIRQSVGQAAQPRPRTIKEALARQQQTGLAGQKMRQPGGVKREALVPSFDVKATPFGAYDAAIIAAVQNRWYDLLDSRNFARERSGKVVLEFRLNYDGRVSEMNVVENSVDELLALLCQRAVLDPSPYAPWPSDMRRLVGGNFREVRFTFYYN